MEDRKLALSPLDHLMPRYYTMKCLYFPLSNPDVARITSVLKSSLQRTFETLPILSGTVQPAPQTKQRGSLCVGAPWNEIDEVFCVNDLSLSDLDYENLRQNHFPMATSKYYGIISLLTSRGSPLPVKNPVMMAQVNFFRNGMILVPLWHHSCIDGIGGVAITELWATFCRGEDGAEMMGDGILDRERLMFGDETGRLEDFREYSHSFESCERDKRLQDDGQGKGLLSRGYNLSTHFLHSLAVFPKKIRPDILPSTMSPTGSSAPQLPKEVDTEIFFFSRSKLGALKSAVSASVASAADIKTPSYISTNDALSALIFACVTEARRPFNPTGTTQAIPLALTVSGRRLLNPPLPEKYVGNMSLFCHLDVPLHTITPETRSIAAVAHQIRKCLSQLDESYVRELIGALNTVDDTGKVAPASRVSKYWPFMITPWTGQGFYGIDWGTEIGVKCERVRIPKVSRPEFDGVIIILPELKVENGIEEEEAGLEVMVGLEKRAMQRLRGMKEWTTWAQWRCS